MKLRFLSLAVAAVAFSSSQAGAQPPVPMRPSFNPIMGFMGGGPGGVGFYYGLMRPQVQMAMMQNQMNMANANMMNLQNQMVGITNMVNPNLPRTGRGGMYNSLGHWYPMSRYGMGGMGMGGMGGMGMGGMGMMGQGGYGMINPTSSPLIQSNYKPVGR